MPERRLLGRLASVSPASPTNRISDAESSRNRLIELSSFGMIFVRKPISAPLVLTRNGEACSVEPSLGDSAIVTPRASLLWNPSPALTKNSVLANGPSTTPNLGLPMKALALPELAGVKKEFTDVW